eukprot:362598-Chlamydomonas_euryale.AAC.1
MGASVGSSSACDRATGLARVGTSKRADSFIALQLRALPPAAAATAAAATAAAATDAAAATAAAPAAVAANGSEP